MTWAALGGGGGQCTLRRILEKDQRDPFYDHVWTQTLSNQATKSYQER